MTKKRDLLAKLDVYDYVKAIMEMPLGEGRRVNGSHQGQTVPETRILGQYRGVCQKIRRMAGELGEIMTELSAADRTGEEYPELWKKRRRLREITVESARLRLKKREIEELRDSIVSNFVRHVVQHRYFDDPDRRLPTWQDTARELGIGVSGEELRRYVCSKLRKK
ncbi:MAG: hypothetical protein IJ806_01090 [Ruminococcus sp.]|nr:hypothetical protein [Ruminococcus sp.]